MNSQFAFALLFSFVAIAFGAAIPAVPMQCSENEIFKPCGSACAPTCSNPNPGPFCTKQCVVGCFCKEGYLRNANKVCVPVNECEKLVEESPMNIVLPPEMQCKENEEFRQCRGCDGTCENPNPICPRICVPGCACKKDHVRDGNGRCMPMRQCPTQQQEEQTVPENIAVLPRVCTDRNEEFLQCRRCDGTCENPNPICPKSLRVCKPGCSCKMGHVRDGNGRCMPVTQCPVEQQQPAPENIAIPPPMCDGINEVFRSCKRCDGTCDKPNPICPRSPRICKPGCACKEGHVRDISGVCVPLEKCPAPQPAAFIALPPEEPKCPENEIFRSCGSACPPTCADPHPSPLCTRQCVVGCFCKEGFLRNAVGRCVQAANCEA